MTEKPRKENRAVRQKPHRALCHVCRRPLVTCYCSLVKPFECKARFVILSQPREAKHRLGTGRMVHLCVSNSMLLEGVDFSEDERVHRTMIDPTALPILLYPGREALNLSRLSPAERAALVPTGKELVVFVLDGTWKSVRKMIRLSRNLQRLPRLCFDPPRPSSYRIRRQPYASCYSTLEAIHYFIDLLTPARAAHFDHPPPHDNLLEVFNFAINRQLSYLS